MTLKRIKKQAMWRVGLVLGKKFRVWWWDHNGGHWFWGIHKAMMELPNRPAKTYRGINYDEVKEAFEDIDWERGWKR